MDEQSGRRVTICDVTDGSAICNEVLHVLSSRELSTKDALIVLESARAWIEENAKYLRMPTPKRI